MLRGELMGTRKRGGSEKSGQLLASQLMDKLNVVFKVVGFDETFHGLHVALLKYYCEHAIGRVFLLVKRAIASSRV